MKKALALILFGLFLSAFFLGPSALAQTKLIVGKAVAKTFGFLPADVGLEQGAFKKRGLDVEIVAFRGAAPMWTALAAESADIGLGNSGGPLAIAKGARIKILADTNNSLASFVLIVSERAGVRTISDLKGKTIGVTSHGAFTDWVIKRLSERQGWDPLTGITRVPLGPFTGQLAALKRGETHGFVWSAEGGWEVEAEGLGKIFLHFGDVFPEMNFEVMSATEKALKEKPEAIRAFMDGWFEAVKYMKANRDYTIKKMVEVLELKPEIARKSYDLTMKHLPDSASLKRKGLEMLAESYVRDGLLPRVIDIETVVWDRRFLR